MRSKTRNKIVLIIILSCILIVSVGIRVLHVVLSPLNSYKELSSVTIVKYDDLLGQKEYVLTNNTEIKEFSNLIQSCSIEEVVLGFVNGESLEFDPDYRFIFNYSDGTKDTFLQYNSFLFKINIDARNSSKYIVYSFDKQIEEWLQRINTTGV